MNYEEIDLNGTIYIKKTDGEMFYFIPTDAANSDYQQYLMWLEAQTPKTTSKAATK